MNYITPGADVGSLVGLVGLGLHAEGDGAVLALVHAALPAAGVHGDVLRHPAVHGRGTGDALALAPGDRD